MDSRSSWPVAAAAAAVVALLPAPTFAANHPINPLEPPSNEAIFDDSDPWRPDVDGGGSALRGPQVETSSEQVALRPQPAARPESWFQVMLRVLRAFFLGGLSR